MTRLRVLRYPNPCTLRLRSAKGDGLLIGRGGNDSASPRPRDRENHRSLSIYFFRGTRVCRPLFDIFLVPSAEKAERLFASSFFDRTICESTGIGKFNGEKIFFFFILSMCISAIEYDDYSYLSKKDGKFRERNFSFDSWIMKYLHKYLCK